MITREWLEEVKCQVALMSPQTKWEEWCRLVDASRSPTAEDFTVLSGLVYPASAHQISGVRRVKIPGFEQAIRPLLAVLYPVEAVHVNVHGMGFRFSVEFPRDASLVQRVKTPRGVFRGQITGWLLVAKLAQKLTRTDLEQPLH